MGQTGLKVGLVTRIYYLDKNGDRKKTAVRNCPGGHPFGYQPRATLLNFSDPLETDTVKKKIKVGTTYS
jgi:hypothetical protein